MRVSCGTIAVLLAALWTGPVWAEPPRATVATLHISGQRDRAELTVDGSFQVPTYSIDTLDDGKQVVIHVENAVLAQRGVAVEGSAALIVRSDASSTAKGVRVVVQLTRRAAYRARADKGQIHLLFDALEEAVSGQRAAAPQSREASVRYVGIERRNGRERVVVELDRAAEFRVVPGSSGPARMEIEQAQLSADVPSEVKGDNTGVVRGVRVAGRGSRVMLSVDRNDGSSGTAIREGNRIVWLFAAAAVKDVTRTTETLARETVSAVDGEEVAAFLSDVPLQVGANRSDSRYSGRRIDLDFKDADIHNILRLLSEVGNVNVVTADDVSGSVTIKRST
jgi:type IV pilus assembly protein PilQ